MLKLQVCPKAYARQWIGSLKPSMAIATLLAGDRWSCIDEVVVAEKDGEIVGIATLAPTGEECSGIPTIVAIYIAHAHRRKGIGLQLLETAVDHMVVKGLLPIRIDAVHSGIMSMVEKLPPDKQVHIQLVDMSMGGMVDTMMEI